MQNAKHHERYFGTMAKDQIDCPVCGNITRLHTSGLDTYIATHIVVENGSPETCPGSRTSIRVR